MSQKQPIKGNFVDRTFTNETIRLDGSTFDRCTLTGCTILYGAEAGVSFKNSSIGMCSVQFIGAAAQTVDFLKVFYDDGAFGPLIKELLAAVQGHAPTQGATRQ